MFKLLVFLCAAVFLTLLIGGKDAGQARFGLQGAYDLPALKGAPVAPEAAPAPPVTTAAAPAAVQPPDAPAAAVAAAIPQVTEAAFSPALDQGTSLQAGLTLSLPLVTEPAVAAPEAAEGPAPLRISRVVGSTVNVREGPSAKSAVVDRLARDEMVTVIATDGSGWSRVRIEGDGVEGFVATRYLSEPVAQSALFPSE